MVLNIYNSLSKRIEPFVPISPDEVSLYTCGPTVYNNAHIGNLRAYIFTDILKRSLTLFGYNVRHIMNLTDVDDKTIRDAHAAHKTLREFTEFYSQRFFEDRDALNIIPPQKYTKATDYVREMLEIIETLIDKDFAYITDDGSVYFKVSADQKYGQLVHIEKTHLMNHASDRMKSDEYDKDSAQDFALWKAWEQSDGDVFWEPALLLNKESTIARGRPGWHIECSAMSMTTLGEHIDIHTGGMDNKFPHHENEIAQSECATGKKFVNYWLHNEWLLVDGKKMSKSAGNFYILNDITERGFHPLAFRYLTLQNHYRTPLNFTWESLHASEIARKRLLGSIQETNHSGTVAEEYKNKFLSVLTDDLNTPEALALAWKVVADTSLSPQDKRATVLYFDTILGLGLSEPVAEISIPDKVAELLERRKIARLEKDWVTSDSLREEIKSAGFTVHDNESEQSVTKD